MNKWIFFAIVNSIELIIEWIYGKIQDKVSFQK